MLLLILLFPCLFLPLGLPDHRPAVDTALDPVERQLSTAQAVPTRTMPMDLKADLKINHRRTLVY